MNKNINRANEEQGSAVLKLNEECAQLNKDQERIKLECDKARMAAQEQKQKLENELEKTQGEHNFTVERAEYVLADIKGLETTSSDARTQSGELDSQIDIAKEDFGAENDEAERKKNELQNQSEVSIIFVERESKIYCHLSASLRPYYFSYSRFAIIDFFFLSKSYRVRRFQTSMTSTLRQRTRMTNARERCNARRTN